MKSISGTWFEFTHHNSAEGVYWNPTCRAFTEAQWREKLREIAGLGMKYVVLLATSLVDTDKAEAYFPTDIYPFPENFACPDPIGVLLSEADALQLRVFLSVGYYGPWRSTMENMTSEAVTRRAFHAMEQLCVRYGSHPSFYGWYYPDETCIKGSFHPDFLRYCNRYSAFVRTLDPHFRTLIAPYGTNLLHADDAYVRQLDALDVDIIAYQDEVGVQKSAPEQTGEYFAALRRAHDRSGRSALWADMEVFSFEGEVYHSALIPAEFSRVQRQLAEISDYCDEILCYQYLGLMNRPGTTAFCGHPNSTALYRAYHSSLKPDEKRG